MKYYVVSEEELSNLVSSSRLHSDDLFNEFKELFDKDLDACRAREVDFWVLTKKENGTN